MRERDPVATVRRDVVPVCRTVLAVAREEQLTLMAATLAYYPFGTLLPLCLFVVMGLSTLGDGSLRWVMGLASGTLFPQGTSLPRSALANGGRARLRAAVIGSLILAWSALARAIYSALLDGTDEFGGVGEGAHSRAVGHRYTLVATSQKVFCS